MSVRLGLFTECSGVPPTTQFAYWKGLGTSDALLCMSQTLKIALENMQESKIVQIDFSDAFDEGILIREFSICSSLW